MTRFVCTSLVLAGVLSLFGIVGFIGCSGPAGNAHPAVASTPPQKFDCRGQLPAKIIKQMYDIIEYKDYTAQERQFNITAVPSNPPSAPNAVVTIAGWSGNKAQILQALGDPNFVVGCTVDDTLFFTDKQQLGSNPTGPSANYVMRIGCPPNYGPCGDICVPVGEPCKITSENATTTAWPCATYKMEDSKVVPPSPSSNGNVKSSNSSVNK